MLLLTILLLCDWLSFIGREADSILPRMPRLRNWKYLSRQLLSMHLADSSARKFSGSYVHRFLKIPLLPRMLRAPGVKPKYAARVGPSFRGPIV